MNTPIRAVYSTKGGEQLDSVSLIDYPTRMIHSRQCVISATLAPLQALNTAESKAKPSIDAMFQDVYKTMPPNLREQQEQLGSFLKRHSG